jgi:glycosyltransferase involved in cell wall biosynthesis
MGNEMISFVIPMIHEYPAVAHTVFSIQAEMQDSPYQWEIIVVENGTVDENTERWFTGNRAVFRDEMGKKIKYLFDGIQSGPHARNTGARIAKGKYVMFMDAHTGLGKNSIAPLVECLDDNPNAGLVSGLTSWSTYWYDRLGSYYELFLQPSQQEIHKGGPTLDTHMHGHYMAMGHLANKYPKEYQEKKPMKVVMGSQAYTMYRTQDFLDIGGYCDACRFYPHPEGYMPLKMWMSGKEVYIHPGSYHFHSLFPRKYTLNNDETNTKIQEFGGYNWQEHGHMNIYKIAYILGEEKWTKICNTSLKECGSRHDEDKLMGVAIEEAKPIRKELEGRFIYSLDDILTMARKEKIPGMEHWFKPIGKDPLG